MDTVKHVHRNFRSDWQCSCGACHSPRQYRLDKADYGTHDKVTDGKVTDNGLAVPDSQSIGPFDQELRTGDSIHFSNQ